MLQPVYFTQKLILLFLLICSTVTAQTASVEQQDSSSSNNSRAVALPVKKIYDEDAKSWYAVYTHLNTVNIYLAITDPEQQRKCVMNGIELWFDSKGKKNKKTGILFPFNKNNEPRQGANHPDPVNNGEPHDTRNTRDLATVVARQHEMKLTGFTDPLNGVQNIHHPSGIQVSLYFVKDTLVYEAQLPLNTLPEPLSLNSRMSVGIIEKGMTMPGMDGNGMPPDNGGPGDGMMPPPGPPPGGETGMPVFEDNIIWYKFLLQEVVL